MAKKISKPLFAQAIVDGKKNAIPSHYIGSAKSTIRPISKPFKFYNVFDNKKYYNIDEYRLINQDGLIPGEPNYIGNGKLILRIAFFSLFGMGRDNLSIMLVKISQKTFGDLIKVCKELNISNPESLSHGLIFDIQKENQDQDASVVNIGNYNCIYKISDAEISCLNDLEKDYVASNLEKFEKKYNKYMRSANSIKEDNSDIDSNKIKYVDKILFFKKYICNCNKCQGKGYNYINSQLIKCECNFGKVFIV